MRQRSRRLSAYLFALSSAACSDSSPVSDFPSRVDEPNAQVGDGDLGTAGDGDSLGDGDGASVGDDDSSGYSPLPPASVEDPAEPLPPAEEEIANPFVDASKDAFSTFGADVDSASYDYFRQSVSEYGHLPAPAQVRVEDFVNFFPYDYAVPAFDAAEPFAIALAAAPHPMGRATKLVRVGIQAKAPPPEEKKPANVVFLVDVSGSMSAPDKLPLVQVVLKNALNVLAPTDKVSIVTYAGETSVRLAPTEASDKLAIEKQIDDLESGGGTAGEAGITLAYAQAQEAFIKGGINHVILCTDGDFNLGLSSDEELVNLIKSKRASGITLTALGFGHDNLNDGMMEKVSNAGNGMYSVVFSHDQAVEYANKRLLSTLVHVAKDMKIQVEWNPAHVRAYRLIGYEDRAVADDDFRDDQVDGGEVGAGHRVTALYEVVLTGEQVPMPAGAPALDPGEISMVEPEIAERELVRVKVRYKPPMATDADPAAEVVRAIAPADVAELSGSEAEDIAWSAAVATFAEVLRGSPYAARSELTRVGEVVHAQKARDVSRSEFAALFDQALSLFDATP